MSCEERADDFEERRAHLRGLSDEELHNRFWELAGRLVEPLIEEARSHTSPAIERSVLLRMGFSSLEAKAIVNKMSEKRVLAHGNPFASQPVPTDSSAGRVVALHRAVTRAPANLSPRKPVPKSPVSDESVADA